MRVPIRLSLVAVAVVLSFDRGHPAAILHEPDRPELVALVRAAGPIRSIEGRLTGGFGHASWSAGQRVPHIHEQRILAAGYPIAARVAKGDAGLEPALASMYLLIGRAADAVQLLERAVTSPAAPAAWLSDLAAAYLGRGDTHAQFEDYVRALAAAERALDRDPRALEAWFNRALAMERMSIPHAARAWAEYLERDGASEFTAEARAHRRALLTAARRQAPDAHIVAAENPGRAALRPYVSWARALEQGDESGMRRALADGWSVASALSARGDRFHDRVVRDITASRATPDRRRSIARGTIALDRGFASLERDDLDVAAAHFEEARTTLARRSRPLFALASLRLAIIAYYEGEPARAIRLLDEAEAASQAEELLVLQSRARRVRGLLAATAGRFDEALRWYGDALDISHRLGAHGQAAALNHLLAEVFDYLGQRSEGWNHRARALAGLGAIAEPGERQSILVASALAAVDQGLPEVARHLQEAARAAAQESGRPADLAEAWILLARIENALGNTRAAAEALRIASYTVKQIGHDWLRKRNEAELALARAAAGATGLDIDAPLKYFSSIEGLSRLSEVFHARAMTRMREGNPDVARRELDRALETFQRLARGLNDDERRLTHDATGRPLYDALVDLEARRTDDAWSSLVAIERYRHRFDGLPFDAAAMRRLLVSDVRAAGAAAISYASLPDRLLIWRVAPDGGIALVQKTISREQLAAQVDAFVDAVLENDERRVRTLGRRLFSMLVEPVAPPQRSTLWIVPDGPLHRLPFAVLTDPGANRFALERWVIAYRPSLVAARFNHRPRPGDELALVVGDPATVAAPRLPAARREAPTIAALYPRHTLLIGPDATRAAVERALAAADVLHFGGHAVVNRERPLLSRLLLAAPAVHANSPDLFVYELQRMDLHHLRLAILAACKAADSRAVTSDGLLSLAAVLVTRGVATVVASLFDLPDEAASRVFVRFHEEYRQTGDAPASLRAAQIDAMQSASTAMSDWAGLMAITR